MSTNSRNLALLAAALLFVTPAWAIAQSVLGTRAAGMAGAFVAVADDASAVYWNPAGVATGPFVSMVIDTGSSTNVPDARQTTAAHRDSATIVGVAATAMGVAYYRVASYGTSAVHPAVTSLQSREEVGRSVHALVTHTAGVTLVQSLSEHIVIGATPKLMRGSARRGLSPALDAHEALDTAKGLEGPFSTAFDVDAGLMVSASRFRLGLVARNLTRPSFEVTEGGQTVQLDRELRVGGAWGSDWTGISRVIVSVDGDLMSRPTITGDRRDVAAGVETWWRQQRLGLRGGVRRSTTGDARAAVAAGISAGLTPGVLLEAHVVRGQQSERSWSVGVRMMY